MSEYECTNCGHLSGTQSGPCPNCKLSAPPRVSVGMLDAWKDWTQSDRNEDLSMVRDLLKGEC